MTVPPLGATGLDKSDPSTFGMGFGSLAPSSMGASEGFRQQVSDLAVDRPLGEDQDEPVGLSSAKALTLLRDYSGQSRSFFQTHVHAAWQRSFRAVRNEHYAGSLYLRDEFRARSKLFKPKTRAALRKRLASTAKAIFSPGDVVSVSAEDDTNKEQMASAQLKQELVAYRLSDSTLRNGVPWFQIAMGARHDADVTSICCSKQFWNYKEIETDEDEVIEGEPDPDTGESTGSFTRKKTLVLIDKPDIMLIAPENVRFDANCNWTNIGQLSEYVILSFPMTVGSAMDMIRQNSRANIPWRSNVTEDMLRGYAGDIPSETVGPRSAREAGRDPQQQASGNSKNVWLNEVFVRYQGRDYVFWAIKDVTVLSDPVPVEKAYPWLKGERPVVIGTSTLDPHKTYSMSPVESWQQTNQEINELANLRLDHMKQIVSPPTKVKRGAKVDLAQIQRKTAHSVLMLNDLADVETMEMPDTPPSLFTEASMLNTDMDDLAGNMDTSSVAANQNLSETLGGMHLLSESANQVSDFDLSIWVETWLQLVMVQFVKLIEHYESDAKILAVCGQRADLVQQFGITDITDELLRMDTTVRVNVGVGATSMPLEKIKRFSIAYDTAAKSLAPFVQQGKVEVEPDAEAIMDMCFSAANFRQGSKTFFKYVGPPRQQKPPPPDPKLQIAQIRAQTDAQKNQVAQERNQADAMLQAQQMKSTEEIERQKLIANTYSGKTAIDVQHMKLLGEMHKSQVASDQAEAIQGRDHAHQHSTAHAAPFLEHLHNLLNPQPVEPAGDGSGSTSAGVMMAPKPSPKKQPQPGMYATL